MTLSSRRRWAFRLLALSVVPLLCVAGLELILRLFGYGYPTTFFLPFRNESGEKIFVENGQYSRLFFPRSLTRRPPPIIFPATKAGGTYRIFVFGESAAMGDPDPSFSFSRLLETMLSERFPATRFEVINVSFTAINSHVLLPIARECADRSGDLWIIYMGNNEVAGPFGPATVLGSQAADPRIAQLIPRLRSFRSGQLLDDVIYHLRPQSEHTRWSGLQMFMEHQIRSEDDRLSVVETNFRENLNQMLDAAARSGARVILSIVAGNLQGSAPFGSSHSPQLTPDAKAEWQKHFESGKKFEAGSNWQEALGEYLAAAKIDSSHAELQFRMAGCYLKFNAVAEAREAFVRARDYDTLRVRTDSRLNKVIADIAQSRQSEGVNLFDAEAALSEASLSGIPGDEQFFDHVHFTFEGNLRLAVALADKAAELLPDWVRRSDTGVWPTTKMTKRRVAFTSWNEYELLATMLRRLAEPPFSQQFNHNERQLALREKVRALKSALDASKLDEAADIYREAISSRDDYYLEANFAKLLHNRGQPDEAAEHAKKAAQLAPHSATVLFNAGLLVDKGGRSEEAVPFFRKSLERSPDNADALYGLAESLVRCGKLDDAEDAYDRALSLRPGSVQALLGLGLLRQHQDRMAEAGELFQKALDLQPNSSMAHVRYAGWLSASGKRMDAVKHIGDSVRLDPEGALVHYTQTASARTNDAIAFFELANALAAAGEQESSLRLLQTSIQMKPDLWEARYLLGVEFATKEQLAEAAEQFAEVVRIKPDFPLGHLNLGVALARELKLQQAYLHFQRTLELDPTNKLAQQYLQTTKSMLKGKF